MIVLYKRSGHLRFDKVISQRFITTKYITTIFMRKGKSTFKFVVRRHSITAPIRRLERHVCGNH